MDATLANMPSGAASFFKRYGHLLLAAPPLIYGMVFIFSHRVLTDFVMLYCGSRIFPTGHLYDSHAMWAEQLRIVGKYGPALLYTRLPCFAVFLWPLAQLPFWTAKYAWICLQIAAMAAAILLWPGSKRIATVVVCWSWPLMMCLGDATDTALLFFWLVLWWRLESRNRPRSAGVALAFCIAKFHLFLFLPLLLLRHRRWRVIEGALLGISGLAAVSFAAAGWSWPQQFAHVLATPAINPQPAVMPNLHGLFPAWEIPLAILTAAVTCAAIFRLDYADGLAAALLGSLLCSHHAYAMDGVILLPPIILLIEKYRAEWPSFVAALFASPFPWFYIIQRR